MLNVLSAVFGPHRAVSIYAFLKTWGLALAGALVMVVIVSVIVLVGDDGEHEHEAFLTVPVLSATAINGDLRNGVVASVRLPDGSAVSLTSTDAQISQSVGSDACVEKRVYVESGEARYRLKLPRLCGSS
ncbi:MULTISPECIES: hypothetical protein [unclassified Ruegeria]|uniref:hypothetical protein n=1 Tax=unclassified Ruegeria TaxID=2625375 RepID=UPI00148904D2|nr:MULTISPECIES: hypothetical protein [unclassified Ruegeria]